ncbi:hypothetical protein [Comamonas sp. 17RB]|uniref:hypothetical protein n=1 Tax=Comamonas sp. 17RB TaxID=3047025 RepID=UPI0024B715A7|nr:hypothetical protein [Comamonas sp. 17RB]MDI9854716.1 hypothetical protein [Comamonas sp. 17RB]
MKILTRFSTLAAGAGIGVLAAGIAGDRPGLWLPGTSLFCVGIVLFGASKLMRKPAKEQ